MGKEKSERNSNGTSEAMSLSHESATDAKRHSR